MRALDLVRHDAEWQQILREVYNLHLKMCEIANERNEELQKNAEPGNVTPREVDIDEKYDAKFKELEQQLQAVRARQISLRSTANDNPTAYQFRIFQEGRVQNGPCVQPPYRRYSQSAPNDP